MGRVNIINFNLLTLPRTACLNPSPSFYRQFQGYTLGLAAAIAGIGALWAFGAFMVAPVTLHRASPAEREDRLARFGSTCLARALLVLYLVRPLRCSECIGASTAPHAQVYPGVSVTIFSMFSCTTLGSGASYLDADMRIKCYDRTHWRYIGGAIAWLAVVPLGVPAFFVWLLRRFRVPQMALLLTDSAWLRETVKLAWQEGMAQPAVDVGQLYTDNITTAHLEGLVAFFLRDASAEQAAAIAMGGAPPLQEPSAQLAAPVGLLARAAGRIACVVTRARDALERLVGVAAPEVDSPEAARRATLLRDLLNWARTCGQIAIPALQWVQLEEPPPPKGLEMAPAAEEDHLASRHVPAPFPAFVRSCDLPRLEERAVKEVGFLFTAYHVGCWRVGPASAA